MKTAEDFEYIDGIAELTWMNLADAFRRACALYHKGRESDAMKIAHEELPELIDQWSEVSGMNVATRRIRLMSMFVEEGRKVGEVALAQKMLSAYMSSQALSNRKAKEMLQSGQGFVGGIRLVQKAPVDASNVIQVPVDFEGDSAAMQMMW
jgi:hypothetical protein